MGLLPGTSEARVRERDPDSSKNKPSRTQNRRPTSLRAYTMWPSRTGRRVRCGGRGVGVFTMRLRGTPLSPHATSEPLLNLLSARKEPG